MLVFRNVMSNFSPKSQILNLSEFELEKGVFCTPSLQCIEEMIKTSYEEEMCGENTLGAGYLLIINAILWHTPKKEEKSGHWDHTDTGEIIVTKGEVEKVIELSIYDTVLDVQQKITAPGLSIQEITQIIEREKEKNRIKKIDAKLEVEFSNNCRYMGDNEWVVVSKKDGWYPPQSLKEKDWIFIHGDYLKVHRKTGQLEICVYIDHFSEYKYLTNLVKEFIQEYPEKKIWYEWDKSDPPGFKRILFRRYPQVEIR